MNGLLAIIAILCLSVFTGCESEPGIDQAVDLMAPAPEPVIGVLPLGDFDDELAGHVAMKLTEKYGYITILFGQQPLPQEAYTTIKKPRYRADTIIHWLRENKPDSIDYVVGLTDVDISVTKYEDRAAGIIKEPLWKYRDFGIFGLGFRPGEACLISTYRLKKNVKDELMLERLRKVAFHEVGHNLGLPHCPTEGCFMQDANESITTVDDAGEELCSLCKGQLLGMSP